MKLPPLPVIWLRVRLAVSRWPALGVGAGLLCLACIGALAWLIQARDLQARQLQLLRQMAALPAPLVTAPPPVSPSQNLALFYAALGERRYAGEQVKTLFDIATKTGLELRHGDYKAGYERNARLYTYQITLPVKGSYRAIWQFALSSLRAIPFASLDEINFKRDAIADANVEARLCLTLYLSDRPRGGQQ
jgi:hypothetical protein